MNESELTADEWQMLEKHCAELPQVVQTSKFSWAVCSAVKEILRLNEKVASLSRDREELWLKIKEMKAKGVE